jgi:hypothetical protein
MGHKVSVDMGLKIDNASGSITDISGSVNSQSLASALNILEDSGMGDEERTYLPGLNGATIDLSGFYDTTTEAIFGPLIGNRTSITKTIEFKAYANRYYNGEAYPTSVQVSGSPDTLEVWSASFTFDGAVNRTTKALS